MATQQPQPSSSNMAQESSTTYVSTTLRLSYKVPFLVRLRSAVFSIARFLRVMPEGHNPHVTPEFLPIRSGYRYVDSYRDRLRSLYTEPDMQHLEYDRWKMTELRTFKDKNTRVKHEYLIATFADSAEDKVHLRIERRIQDSSAKSLFKHVASRVSPLTDPDIGGRSGPSGTEQDPDPFTKRAMDEVSLYPDPKLESDKGNKKEKALVEHIKFSKDHRISLPKLILLACAINEHSKTYHLTQNNCYWFCYTVAEALKERYPENHLVSIRGRKRQGTWRGLGTNKLYANVNVNDLLTTTDRLWDEFITQIEGIINNPNSKLVVAANQRAEEEARLREEAERRAQEAERRIAELEAKLAAQAKEPTA